MNYLINILNYGKLPKHIGIIMDGNRRWAKNKYKNEEFQYKGHEKGAESLNNLLENFYSLKIEKLTIFALSIDNLKRSKKELNYLENILNKFLDKLKNNIKKIIDKKIKLNLRFIGNISLFSKKINEKINNWYNFIENNYNNLSNKNNLNIKTINICLCYDSEWEVNKIDSQIKKIKYIKDNLLISDDIDILIRTGGNHRISNFLIYQINNNTQIEFLETKWPDFGNYLFIKILLKYQINYYF